MSVGVLSKVAASIALSWLIRVLTTSMAVSFIATCTSSGRENSVSSFSSESFWVASNGVGDASSDANTFCMSLLVNRRSSFSLLP